MLNFLMNDKEYEIQANMQVATILSQFDSGYVMDVVEDTINSIQFNFDIIPRPNIVQSFEEYFKVLLNTYPTDTDNINLTRNDAYHNIMNIICSKYGLRKTETENTDIYTLAFYMYDFFVSKFDYYLVNFYANYITRNKSDIFSSLGLDKVTDNGDVSTTYNKYAFGTDQELATVVANLPVVLGTIKNFDIPDIEVYKYAYGNILPVITMMEDHLEPAVSIFSMYNNILFNSIMYPNIITQIRLKIQMENKEAFMVRQNIDLAKKVK